MAVLGLHRLSAVEEAVRAAPPDTTVTLAVVTGEPDELAHLARLVVADVGACLRQAFPPATWPRLQVVLDDAGALAAAAGVRAVSDETEVAVRIADDRIVARAEGRGACHAAATATCGVSGGYTFAIAGGWEIPAIPESKADAAVCTSGRAAWSRVATSAS